MYSQFMMHGQKNIKLKKILYSGCCLWYLVLWFSSRWSGAEPRVVCLVCRCPKHVEQAIRSAIKTSVASSWHFISTYSICPSQCSLASVIFSKNITTGMCLSYLCRTCTKLLVSFGCMYEIGMTRTVITSFSPLKPGFDPRAHVGSVVNTAVLRLAYPPIL